MGHDRHGLIFRDGVALPPRVGIYSASPLLSFMPAIKIHGAGSIGNHLANAARRLGWAVTLCDIADRALERARREIYPSRYGAWDEAIQLHNSRTAPKGGFDLIAIGTPPEFHLPLALEALEENPRAIQVEKPVCMPDLAGAQELFQKSRERGVAVFVGYDHVVGSAACEVARLLGRKAIGGIETLDVEFREHWGGIFAAHPWLSGPADSYLGFWKNGGGASGEHSHALNLWQHFAQLIGAGRVVEVSALLDYTKDGVAEYDRICALHLVCESGFVGRVVQDVVTRPVRKWARIQGRDGFVEWHCGAVAGRDDVRWAELDGVPQEALFPKTRPDDFIREIEHIQASLADGTPSPISLERGLDTMLVIAAAHLSAQQRRNVKIDYSAGYRPESLSLC